MEKKIELLEHINEVLKQWITDEEVSELVTELTELITELRQNKTKEAKKLIAQASKMIQEQYAPEEDEMKVYVIRVEAPTNQEVMDILDYAGYDVDLLEVYEN